MQVFATIAALRGFLRGERAAGRSIGFVPTMGALHAGHRSLLAASVRQCDTTVLSIFVNPLQFRPGEDLLTYPRTLQADQLLAEEAGVAAVFAPTSSEMYPGGAMLTSVRVTELADTLDGLSRPGHFEGVATVVAKLFSIIGECNAYFGEKDWQQLTIVRQMVADLSMPVNVVGCATVRDQNGLALSSRNVYLDDEQRNAAVVLSKALQAGARLIEGGNRMPLSVISTMTEVLKTEPLVQAEYATVVDDRLRVPSDIRGPVRLLIAGRIASTRLIDNWGVVA